MPSSHLQRRLVGFPVVLALLVAISGGTAWALPSQGALDAARERAERLEELVGDAEAELAVVRAELVVLEERLTEAEGKLEVAVAVHREAEREATAASDRARAAEAELRDASEELRRNRDTLSSLARDTYKHGAQAGSPALAAFEMLDGPSEGFADRLHYLQRGVSARAAALEASTAIRTRVSHLTERARQEERELEQREQEADETRVEAATLHAEVADLTSETSDNLERSAQLVATLASEQQDVEVRIAELEAQVAREREEAERRERERREREARERAEREARERAEREARERAARERRQRAANNAGSSSGSSSSGGSGSSSSSGSGGSGSSGGGSVSVRPGPSPSLRTVGGITVAASLAPQLEALLNHARRDGIVLGGHGYRSPEVTARLRVINGCRDVYTSPASACRVPTARPGSSQHEVGLAVDFTYQGQTICFPRRSSSCTGNAAFTWLKNNAGSYGLRNLPSEAWHWSTTGR